MRRISALTVMLVVLATCRPGTDDEPKANASRAVPMPAIGLAVSDSARRWCAEFEIDSAAAPLKPGTSATIVLAGAYAVASLRARIGGRRTEQCPASFPQPRWFTYTAFDLELVDAAPPDVPTAALIVVGDVPWTRDAQGVVRTDIDGDGSLEEARRCTADEGEHFTIWTLRSGDIPVRRWHEYFDWGGFTDPTCRPGENGQELK